MRSKVRTRIGSILLVAVMLLSLLPVHALADGPIQVGTGKELTEALTNGGSIQLNADVTVDTKQNWTITKDVVLDLNGHDITSTYGESNYFLMTIRGASLTVTDTSALGTGTISADVSGGYGIQLYSNSTFNLEGGTIISQNETVDIYTITTGCTINISGGKLVSTADSAMCVRGSGTEVNITGGELVSEGGITGVFVSSGGSTDPESIVFNMNGGKLTSTSGPAILTDYALTVNYGGDAVIESENTGISVKGSTVLNVAGGTITADSYALQGHYDSSIHVTSGKIETTRSNLAAVSISGSSTVEIKGGTLVGTKALSGSKENITIAGGTFQTSSGTKVDVSEYLPEGNTQDENGQVIVDTAAAKFAVDGVGYTTLEKALAALKDGSTMTIQPGEYDVTTERASKPTYGSSFIIDEKNVTIQAADPNNKPVLYGFSNEFNAGVDSDGINGQGTIYVSSSGVTLKDLVIMPLGGIGPNANNWQKTVEVTSTATGFTMTGCETTPNTHQKDGQDNSMAAASGNIHVSINDAEISGNSFGAGTTVSAGWKTSAADTYSVDVSGNYWGDGVTAADIAGKIDGNVKVDNYYADVDMTELVTVGGTPVSTVDQLEKALTAAKAGDTIVLAPGTYELTDTLTLNKAVTVTSQEGKTADTTLVGPTTVSQTVLLGSGAALKNVTVTRAGNTAEEWEANQNNSGVSFAQNLTAETTLENCIIKNNRNGVYLNNTGTGSGYAVIKDNQIIDNRTGINMTNNVNNSQITGNTIKNNSTLGIVYYEAGYGTNLGTVELSGNTILDNWYGAINLKTLTNLTTGALSIGENTIVAAGEQVNVAYEASKEPGYTAQIPSWGGGSSTKPTDEIADVILTPNENVAGQTAASIAGLVDYGTLEVAPTTMNVHNAAELRNAVVNALPGTVIDVYPGDYDIEPAAEPSVQGQGGWYLPITASNITIQGVDGNGNPITDAMNTKATIYSTTETANGSWATQNLIAVFGDNVTISGLTIMPKAQVNKTVEVNGKNFTIQYCSIVPNSKVTIGEYADPNNGGSLYFAGDKGAEVVKGNYFKQMVLSFDSVDQAESILVENNIFDTPRTDTQMISNVTWTNPPTLKMAPVTIKDNTFKNLPEDYNKVVLQRMEGTFILEDNRLVKANGSLDERDIADMVSFDATFFKDDSGNVDWDAFVATNPKISITDNGITTVLTPPASEGGEVVAKTVKVTPVSASIYTGASITLAVSWEGFIPTDAATWTVAPTATLNVSTDGKSAVFQASQAGQYTVTVTVDGVTASAVITVTNAPVDPVDPITPSGGGSSSSGDYTVSVDRTTGGKITVSPSRADKGDTVTITVKPDKGYELDKLIVTDKDGDTIKLTEKDDNQFTFKMPGSRVEVEASFKKIVEGPINPFTDVSESNYYYDAVLWAVENGVTNGTSATTFGPNMAVSRAQMVTFLWRAHGSPRATGTNPFADVSTSDYYYDAVLWAVSNGITNGTSATTFGPAAPVTRAQAVTFQWRAVGSPVVSGSSFGDVAADAYYVNAVTWAVAKGITNGTGSNTFSPDAVVSRAQAVTFLWRELA